MTGRVYQVLFLCTGNSIRSVIAECILARRGAGRFEAHSAGSHPGGHVHPGAVEVLVGRGHDVRALRSKSWQEFAGPGALSLDFVFTVCDFAASEPCPVWPGGPVRVHWGVEDPTANVTFADSRRAAFEGAYDLLDGWIERFVALPIETLNRVELGDRLEGIAR